MQPQNRRLKMTNRSIRQAEVVNGVVSDVQNLFVELVDKKILEKCTHMEKTKISSLINELKHKTRQLKNIVTL